MKRFDFPLERVRRWRRTDLDLEQAKLDALLAELARLEAQRENLRQQLDAEGAAAQEGIGAGVKYEPERLATLGAFRQFVKRRELEITMRESDCRLKLREQRGKVAAARRNCEVLERLRDRAFAQWDRACAKELEDAAADLYLAKLHRSGERERRGSTSRADR